MNQDEYEFKRIRITSMGKKANEKKSWLDEGVMNLLVDYYPEVQFRPYGSGATRKNVVPFLKQLDLGYLCIYAKGHSGYCTWPSSLKTQHNMLGGDMPKLFRAYTREAGTKLVLYYSGMVDGIAGERHPDWRQCNIEGKPAEPWFNDFKCFIAYPICPLSGYWNEWVSVQLRELITNYDPDGIWVDGDWPGPCYCERCRKRFRSDTGWSDPWSDLVKRPDFHAEYIKSWNRITHEWRTQFRNFVKSLNADCVYSAGNVSPRREFAAPFDWRSGDFFSPGFFHLHDMARMMRWYGTLDVPYDAYICDTSFTHVRKNVRSRTKTLDRMLQEAATVAAAGGQVGYWTYPLGDGAWVPSRMKKAIEVRKFLKEREDLFIGSRSARWNAILVSDPSTPTFGGANVEGAHKALAALHLSPDVMDESGIAGILPYELIVLPEQAFLDKKTAELLESYVHAGGKILSSGASLRFPEFQKTLGVKSVRLGDLKDGHVILKTCDEPTGVDGGWDRVELERGTAKELYPLFMSWDQLNFETRNLCNNWPMHGQLDEENPEKAGCPAAIMRTLGKGRVVHICTDIFSQYRTLGAQMLRWLREIIDELMPTRLCRTDAPSWVDLSLRRSADGRLLVHFVNQNPGRDICRLNSDDTWVDEIPEVGPYMCELRISKKPRAVSWEPGGHKPGWSWTAGLLKIEVPRFRIHGCAAISLA